MAEFEQNKTSIRKIIKRIFLIGFISAGVFFVMALESPTFRKVVLNLAIAAQAITIYNRARPWLNMSNRRSCLKKLAKTDSKFILFDNQADASGCTLRNVVFVSGSHLSYASPCLMTCSLALAMYEFEKEVIQPLANKHFNQPVVKINHVGTFCCRPMRGSSRLLSEHAYANAIDIASFQLRDGTIVSVKQHWKRAGKKSKFLHELAQQACKHFRKVLTPNYNALHYDHFHFDMGLLKKCGY